MGAMERSDQAGAIDSLRDKATEVWLPPGVRLDDPCGDVVVRNNWAIIGAIVMAGTMIEIVPCRGLSAAQRARLLATAVQVWMFGRNALQGWKFQDGLGWIVKVGAHFSGELSRWDSISAMSSSEAGKPLVCAGLIRPLGR